MNENLWPALPLKAWLGTYETLHMWMQMVGKIRLQCTPPLNHWWNVPLYVSARGLTTRAMPYGTRTFEMEFDFVDHRLLITTDGGVIAAIDLRPISVADFYQELFRTLHDIGIDVRIWPMPVEVSNPIPFDQDHTHAGYDPDYVNRFWRVLVSVSRVLEDFRSEFIGKCSPVHFFWGSFDLAVTRFSGRRAPERKDADRITKEAYSHEVISHGFWPGNRPSGPLPERTGEDTDVCEAAFYAYAAPEPAGFSSAKVRPPGNAFYSRTLKEFILPYEDVRGSASPEQTLKEFLHSTYEAGATLGTWNRAELEHEPAPAGAK